MATVNSDRKPDHGRPSLVRNGLSAILKVAVMLALYTVIHVSGSHGLEGAVVMMSVSAVIFCYYSFEMIASSGLRFRLVACILYFWLPFHIIVLLDGVRLWQRGIEAGLIYLGWLCAGALIYSAYEKIILWVGELLDARGYDRQMRSATEPK